MPGYAFHERRVRKMGTDGMITAEAGNGTPGHLADAAGDGPTSYSGAVLLSHQLTAGHHNPRK